LPAISACSSSWLRTPAAPRPAASCARTSALGSSPRRRWTGPTASCSSRASTRRSPSWFPQLVESGILDGAFEHPADRARLVIASTIRNPFDANVSSWHRWYRKLDPSHRKHNRRFVERAGGQADRPSEDIERARHDFERWLTERYQPKLWQRLRGRYRPIYAFRWTAGSDVVLHFDRLQEDFDALLVRLGVPDHHEIPQVNVTRKRDRRPYQDWYTPKARAIIEKVFAEDIAEHGYSFEGSS
jgi:hypothetical protein